jgi:hypothetical protein
MLNLHSTESLMISPSCIMCVTPICIRVGRPLGALGFSILKGFKTLKTSWGQATGAGRGRGVMGQYLHHTPPPTLPCIAGQPG